MRNDNYVYLHIKKLTGEPFYIGKGYYNRAFVKGKKRNKWWNNIVNKYGLEIIFLATNLTEQEAIDLEIKFIKEIGRRDLGLGPLINLTDGGEGTRGYIPSKEKNKNHSDMMKGRPSPRKGVTLTKDIKDKISSSRQGIPSHRRKILLDIETGIFYLSIKEASEIYNIKRTTLNAQLTGQNKNKTNLIYV